ncbi:MAG: hypothetical protein M3198_05640, partial [Actinomycetota bacterium]|nr:hypothetical protein [Actinomycetota bacterium]
AGLAVVWDVNDDTEPGRAVEVRVSEHQEHGATHELLLYGIADKDRLPLVSLKSLVTNAPE